MILKVNNTINLELINESHTQKIFELVDCNRNYLRRWLAFVDRMQSVQVAENFVKGTMSRNKDQQEFAFLIIENDIFIGRIGVYKIDLMNKIGEIGYWIDENCQGRGIVYYSCLALLEFCFNELLLNRIEIKCAVENYKSNSIPQKLNFLKEGVIRHGELLHEQLIDLNFYSLLKHEFISLKV